MAEHVLRTDLGGSACTGPGQPLLSLFLLSDAQVMDTVSPARCEWVELLADEPHWQPLLHMHRPYEALAHWALAAHVERVRRTPLAPWSARPYDLTVSLGDNVDNAQHNELDVYLNILAGGRSRLSAYGGVHEPSTELGAGAWPYWCPEPDVADRWKPLGYPSVPDFVARASAELVSPGIGMPWSSVPGNHDLLRQGTALPEPRIENIATGNRKLLARPAGLEPVDPLALFVEHPAVFCAGGTRLVPASDTRRALDKTAWLAAHVARGAAGYTVCNVQAASTDAVVDTEHVRIILLDTNHPAGDFEGSIGTAQLEWLDQRLAEVDAQPGRVALLASHHGSVSLTNTRGADPQRRHAAALTAVAHRHASVVAWLVGHRHLHRITPHPGAGGGFWEITTGAVIDWPTQARSVELLRHADGQLEIICSLIDHEAGAGSLAQLHHTLARRFAGALCTHLEGTPTDGNVRLVCGRRQQ